MATTSELHNYVYLNEYELEETENSDYFNDHEILIEINGKLFDCEIADLHEYDGKLVLKLLD